MNELKQLVIAQKQPPKVFYEKKFLKIFTDWNAPVPWSLF